MNPEKEASKYQDESLDQRIDRIVDKKLDEKLDEKLKGILLTEKEHEEAVNTVVGFDVFEMVKALVKLEPTQKENKVLRSFRDLGWKWISRDKDGTVAVWKEKPVRFDRCMWVVDESQNNNGYENIESYPCASNKDFRFLTWENSPMLIADLIQPDKKER